MKKIVLILVPILLVLGVIITYLGLGQEKAPETPPPTVKEDIADNLKESPEQPKEDVLTQLENLEFILQGVGLENEEIIITFGKAFINLYNGAVQKQKIVSFNNYIENKNLREFTDKMLDLTQKQNLQGRNMINYGLDNEFKESNLEQVKDGLYYLELSFQHAGSRMGGSCS